MPMSVKEAVCVANRIRVTSGQYHFPQDQPIGVLAEAMEVLKVSLQRYRKTFEGLQEAITALEESK